jgi:hypothetical protein
MDTIKAFSRVLLLCGCAVAGSGALHAETITRDAGVTVVRGADDAATAAQRSVARGRSGVAVFRGESAATADFEAPAAFSAPAPRQVVGGQNLWVYDADTGDATACSLRYDIYGNRNVRCSDNNGNSGY